MKKVNVIDKHSEKSIKYERELLTHLKHPFIINMYYSFQDFDNLYLVMDLLSGGDLRYHISRYRRFSECQTKFFIICLILGLEYIHSKNIIHRDIKPENLVLDEKGYVRITDFGIAKLYKKNNYKETSGTPGYMSPEVMQGLNHNYLVDYFAVGVIGYEFMLGRRPYVGKNRKEIKENMMNKQAVIKSEDIPFGWSVESADFINKLLIRKPEGRLGSNIKEHPWVKDYDWKGMFEKKLDAPFVPEKKDNFDKKYCEEYERIGADTKLRYECYKKDENYKKLFINFTYYGIYDNSYVYYNENNNENNKDNNKKKISNINNNNNMWNNVAVFSSYINSSMNMNKKINNLNSINNSLSKSKIFNNNNNNNSNSINVNNSNNNFSNFIKNKNNYPLKRSKTPSII